MHTVCTTRTSHSQAAPCKVPKYAGRLLGCSEALASHWSKEGSWVNLLETLNHRTNYFQKFRFALQLLQFVNKNKTITRASAHKHLPTLQISSSKQPRAIRVSLSNILNSR